MSFFRKKFHFLEKDCVRVPVGFRGQIKQPYRFKFNLDVRVYESDKRLAKINQLLDGLGGLGFECQELLDLNSPTWKMSMDTWSHLVMAFSYYQLFDKELQIVHEYCEGTLPLTMREDYFNFYHSWKDDLCTFKF